MGGKSTEGCSEQTVVNIAEKAILNMDTLKHLRSTFPSMRNNRPMTEGELEAYQNRDSNAQSNPITLIVDFALFIDGNIDCTKMIFCIYHSDLLTSSVQY